MKIIFLNTWEAEVADKLSAWIKEQSADTDIFCFQEAYEPMKILGRKILLDDYYESEAHKALNATEQFFQTTYVKKTLGTISSVPILQDLPRGGLGLITEISSNGVPLITIANIHGVALPLDKLDNPPRLQQSEMIIDFFSKKKTPAVIGGDFNLFPHTKSIGMFKEHGYRDLIQEFNIATTRNQLAWDRYPDNIQVYADYAFISPDVVLKKFSVPDLSISDHLPLILEIEI